ncbi:MAG: S41 family peptidase [Calditrichaeota bacterium]|nr:MAG: S41 family peptidase [Calditrichota bacterium]
MSSRKRVSAAVLLVLVVVLFSGWITSWGSAFSPDYYHQVQKNIELFGRVYQEIAKKYVKEVDPAKFMRAGIEGMLSTLDPYTVLVEKEDNAELQIMSSGKYGGLGMRIGLRGEWPTVVEPPFEGTPALKAGIREGDQILEIDGKSTKGMNIVKVANMLRGEIGSKVRLRILRDGEDEPIEFHLIRDEIIVTDVAYAGMVKDGIGYIKLTHFSRNAGRDIEKAIRKMKKQGLKGLVLDLRSNPGGLLEAAVEVSEQFLPKGKLIVSTEGRANGSVQKYFSEKSPILEDLPLVILVNGLSASASEIVSGAVQDHDRGLIIGSRTFGKGLVQTVIPITGDAALKITTAKYLVPSGRSIQDPAKFFRHGTDVLADREKGLVENTAQDENIKPTPTGNGDDGGANRAFLTEHGRKVYPSHGITPDIEVKEEKLTQYELELLRKTMPFQFAVVYASHHPDLQPGFQVTDEMLEEFRQFLKEREFDYVSKAELALREIEDISKKQDFYASASNSIADLRTVIEQEKTREFDKSRDFIAEELQQEISAKLWGTRAEIEASFDKDQAVQKALEVLSDPQRYSQLLHLGKERK